MKAKPTQSEKKRFGRFEILATATVIVNVFRDLTPYNLVDIYVR